MFSRHYRLSPKVWLLCRLRVLAADVREVYQSICQLFELFLLAVFRSFSDMALADIVGETPTTGAATQPQPPPPDGVSHGAVC